MAANPAQQVMFPPHVQAVISTGQLGAFVKKYQVSLASSIGAIILCFIMAGFFGFTLYMATSTGGGSVGLIVAMLALCAIAVWGIVSTALKVVRIQGQQIYLFKGGIILENKQGVQVLPWSQIGEIKQSITRNYRNGVYQGTTYIYTLRLMNGEKLVLDNTTKEIETLGRAIAEGVAQELLPRALYSIQAGQALTFGKWQVQQQGFSNGKELVPWAQIASVNVDKGVVKVYKVGQKSAWATTMVPQIPNYHVFYMLCDLLMQRARGR